MSEYKNPFEEALKNNTEYTNAFEQYVNYDKAKYAQTLVTKIENRVNKWLKNNSTFINNAAYRAKTQNGYVSDSGEWLSTITTQKNNFDREAESIKNVLNEYKDVLDPKWVQSISSVFDSEGKTQADILAASTESNTYWSQWENEDKYNEWVEWDKEQTRLLNLDVAATRKQADSLQAAVDEYNDITSQLKSLRFHEDDYVMGELEAEKHQRAVESLNSRLAELEPLVLEAAKLRKDATKAEYKQTGKKLKEEALAAPDFETNNNYGKTNPVGTESVKAYLLGFHDDLTLNNPITDPKHEWYGGGTILEGGHDFYEAMSEEEKKILGYYIATDIMKAEEYIYAIKETVGERVANGYAAEADTWYDKVLFSFAAGTDQFGSGVQGLVNSIAGEEKYIPASPIQQGSAEIKQNIENSEGFGNRVLGVAYDIGTTTANMMPSILVGMVNPTAGTVLMGASAGGNAYNEMINLGYDKNQARAYGVMVGASEALLERVLGGISAFGGGGSKLTTKLLSNVDNVFGRIATSKVGSSMISEFTEESLQTILEPWFKSIVTDLDYEAPNIGEVLYSGFLGALSAGLLEGGGSTISALHTTYKGHQIKKTGGVDALTSYAETLPTDTEASKLAGKVKDKAAAYNVGRLYKSLGEGLNSQNYQAMHDYLVSKGVLYEHATAITDTFGKYIAGEKLSRSERKAITANPLVAQAARDALGSSVEIDAETGEYIIMPSKLQQQLNTNNQAYNDVHTALMSLAKKTAGVTEDTTASQDSAEEAKAVGDEQTVTTEDDATEGNVEADTEATENTAPIKNIASIEDGKITYNLEDGSTSNNATASNDIEALVYESVTEMGATVDSANSILDKVRTDASTLGNQELRARFFGMKEVYFYGKHGISINEISKHGFADTLTEAEKAWAYNLGKKDSAEQTAKKEEAAKSKQKPADRQGANEVLNKDGLYYEKSIKKSSLTERQRASVDVAKQIHKILGVNVHLFATYVRDGKRYFKDANGVERIGKNNGMYINGDIYLDINAGQNGEGIMLNTLAHELTHHIEEWSPERYKKLCDFLMEQYAEKGVSVSDLVYREIAKAKKNGRDVSFDEAYSDLIANSMETMLHDGTVLNKLAQTDKVLFNKIKAFIDKIVDRIKALYADVEAESLAGKYVASMKDSFTEIQSLFADALVSAGENFKAATESEMVEVDADTESVNPMLSERTWTESEYVLEREKSAEMVAEALGVSKKKALKYIDDINSIAKMIADARTRLDYEASPFGSAFVSNVEYGGSFDFTTLCKKRRLFTGTFSEIQKKLRNTALTPDDILKIRNMMIERGLEATCGLCYVEGSRANMGKFSQEFIRLYKRDNPNAWIPDMADVNTPDGVESMRINHPEAYEQYEYFWNHYGKLKESDPALFASQQKPKLYEARKEYKGEILKSFSKGETVTKKNLNGGIRMQSFSDFEIIHLIDTMQIIMDMSRVGLAGQAYTKVPEFARAFGNTGLKINLSLIAKGVDADGKLIFDDREGMPHETAFELRNQYSANVGTIIVTFTDEQLMAAMADDRIDYIIPFHRSQWKKGQYGAMGLPKGTKDYTYMQNEKLIKQTYHEYRGKMVKDKATNYMPNEYWDFSKSGKENAEAYLKMCAENNKRPKFYKLLDYDGKGTYSLKKDGSTDGYWKLLIDFKMYDNNGVGSPQKAVTPNFNMEESTKMLDEYKGGHQSYPVAYDVVDAFVEEYTAGKDKMHFSERDEVIDDAISNIDSDIGITDENVAVQMATDVFNSIKYSERDTQDEETYSKIGKEMIYYAEGNRKPDLTLVEVYNERTGKTETTVKFVGDKPKGYIPKKIAYCYKLFERHPDGTLHALFAGASNATPVGEWVYSKGFPYTDSGVKGMNLRERYGWHLSAGLPSAPHLMSSKEFERGYPSKNAYGHPKGSKRVWVRMAYDATTDFNSIADSTKAGDIFGLIPFGGFYAFKENNQSEWVISSAVKIDKILEEDERQQILAEAGYDEYEAWRKKHRATEAEKAESKRKSAESKKAKDEAKKKGLNYLSENSKAMREAISKRIIDNPELEGGKFSEREVDNYSQKEYNDFGWARANDVLSATENADLRSKFAAAISKQANPPKTKAGEYMISVGDTVENKIAYMKGTIDEPIITRIVEIDEYNETKLDKLRRYLYDLERRGIQQEAGGIYRRYDAFDFKSNVSSERKSLSLSGHNIGLGTQRGRSSKKAKRVTRFTVNEDGTYTTYYADGTVETEKQQFSERDSYVEDGNKAVMKKERIDYLIEDSGAGTRKDYARAWIARISPTDYLNLTTSERVQDRDVFDQFGSEWNENVNMTNYDYLGQLKKSVRQTPYLRIDIDTGEVLGHDGRHRIRALEMNGIESVEIQIEFYDSDGDLVKYQPEGKRWESIKEKLLTNQFGTNQTAAVYNLIPLNEDHRSEIEATYGEQNARNDDIRYSERDPDYAEQLEKLNKTLEKENAKLKEDKQNLKELLALQKKVTNGKRFTQTSVIAAAKKLMKYANAKGEAVELARMLNTYYEGIVNSENLDWNDVTKAAEPAVKWLKDHLSIKPEVDETATEIRKFLKKQRVRITEEQKSEIAHSYDSYNNFRKKAMGYITIAEDATNTLEGLWQDLSGEYPDIFDSDVKPAEMPKVLLETMASLRDGAFAREARYEYEQSEAMITQDLLREVYNSYWDVSTLYTVADKAQKEISLLKAKHGRQMNEARDHLKDTVEKLKQDKKEQVAKVRKQYQGIVKSHEDKLIAKHQEQRAREKENRTKTEMRHKIKNVVNDLNRLLLQGNKERNVKIGLQPAVAAALKAINFDTVAAEQRLNGYTDENGKYHKGINQKIAEATDADVKNALEKTRDELQRQGDAMNERLEALRKAYSNIQNQKGDFPDYYRAEAKLIEDKINSVIETVGDTPLRFMTLAQLNAVHDLYTMVLTTVRNANKVFKQGKVEDLQTNASSVMFEVQKLKKLKEERSALGEKLRSYVWNEHTPFYAFNRIGSNTLTSFFWELVKGQNVYAQDLTEAEAFAKEVRQKHGYDNWDTDEVREFKLEDGRTFKVSLKQMMSIYAYSKRKQALDHMSKGGFFFNDKATFRKKGKLLEQIKSNEEGYRINENTLNKIKAELTEEQIKYVDEMQAYLTDMGKKGNEVTRVIWGIDVFKEAVYFPLRSVKDFIYQSNQPAQESSLKNDGMTKETKPHASNPIVLEAFDDVWASHVERMSQYHGLVIPIDNLNKILNYGTWANAASVSVSTMLASRHGSAVNEYLSQFIRDLNGSVSSQGASNPFFGLVGKFKKTAVAASMSTVIQQPTAVLRATGEIDARHFVGKPDLTKLSSQWETLKKYAPIAVIKEIGGFDAGSGRQAKDWLNADTYRGIDKVKRTIDDATMWGAAQADVIGWVAIWDAVKRECVTKYTNLAPNSEEFLKKAGERFTEVIVKTQVYDSTLSRSGYMRSKSDTVKMATAFMGEPTLSINAMYDALVQAKRGTIPKGKMIRTLAANYASMIAASAAASLIYAMRDDDDDESYGEKYFESLGDSFSFWGNLNPLTMLPFAKDIISIFDGWSVERTDVSIIQDIKDAFDALDSDTKSPYRKVEDFAGAIAALLGLPVKNVMRTGREIYNLIEDHFDGIEGGDKGAAFVSGITGEEKEKSKKLYDAIINGDEARLEVYRSEYKDEDSYESAVKKALRENDERIKEAARAYYTGDIRERDRIRNEIADEGIFEEEFVAEAIDAEASFLESKFKAAAKAEAEGDAEEYDEILKTLVEEMHYDEDFVLEGIANEADSLEDTEEEEELTSVYRADDINVALESGDTELALEIIDDLVQTKIANGMDEDKARSSVKSSVSTYWKKRYKTAFLNGDKEEMKRIRFILRDTKLYGTNDVVKTTTNWENGFREEIREEKRKANKNG